ncbi:MULTISPECIES: GlsB/YeaQ/YmgE family stress response membrane protein [Qipengyuania]|uniref:GlsB/YeaQ/YmgE family stress response membrane protein n=1 Tax=Qipengyuania TaxID=1855416 RepID=UPI001C88B3DA|nr:GlsB/YeaQ/YmgE family stress response membrane protein [Qipengyuania aestuarii]MBX7535278.1 hypothetical protein [Qipengyuania aestuarii]
MGLIILIVAGALLGWLATIFLRLEDGRSVVRNILAGTIGSVVVGVATSGGMFLGSIQGITLLWATLGAVVLITAYNLFRQKALR